MIFRSMHVVLLSTGALIGVFAAVLTVAPARGSAPPGTPSAVHVAGIATVGPWFRNGITQPHNCVGVVVHSAAHDTVLTSAHCNVSTGMLFAPGYDKSATPYGVWTVEKSFVDSEWASTHNPNHDFAVLDMAPQTRGSANVNIEDVTGAILLGTAPPAGQHDIVDAYANGINDQPIQCAVTVYLHNGYAAFNCHGYTNGTSGAPWILPATSSSAAKVVGVIGGYQQGGLYEYTSYTAHFGSHVAGVLAQANNS